MSEKRVSWQPISALSLIGSMIDSLLDEMENPYANLQACRLKPHVLDNDTVSRVIQVYSAQADDVWLFETPLYRWRNLNLTPAQREEGIGWQCGSRRSESESQPFWLWPRS